LSLDSEAFEGRLSTGWGEGNSLRLGYHLNNIKRGMAQLSRFDRFRLKPATGQPRSAKKFGELTELP